MVVPPGLSRETRIRRDRQGRWFDGDQPVTNQAVAAAFDSWIDRAPDGRWCLKNSSNWAYVEIEGPPIFVRAARIEESGIELSLSDGRSERLDPKTLSTDEEGRLACTVREGSMPAEFSRAAMIQLEPILDEDERGIFLRVAGEMIRLEVTRSDRS
jgi:uncharacterized protein